MAASSPSLRLPDAANQNAWIVRQEVLKDAKYRKCSTRRRRLRQRPVEGPTTRPSPVDVPGPKLIRPTTVGIASAAKALQDEGLCDKIKISGLGFPSEMVEYALNGCAPKFALWSFVDLGYLTYYTTYLLATGQMEAKEGVTFEAGRLGTYTITKDPTREKGLRILLGPFSVYTKDNVK